MKITAIEIKPGMIIEHKNDYWNVLKTQHVKPGKGGAFNQVELKSVIKDIIIYFSYISIFILFKTNKTVNRLEIFIWCLAN